MGLFQKAVQTFDTFSDKNGLYEAGKEPLAPVGHMIATADIEITLDEKGLYISSSKVLKEQSKVIIPVTEQSAGRSGTSSYLLPHPLCDQIKYLASYDKNSAKSQKVYLTNLNSWLQFDKGNKKLHAIYQYVEKNSILTDLSGDGNISLREGMPDNEKAMIVWRVLGTEGEAAVTHDVSLMTSFSKYYLFMLGKKPEEICMVSGDMEPPSSQHLKGVFSLDGNAKLISANDSRNFTYRGRFETSEEALTVGYVSSQKAHNALKWITANYGKIYGGRAFVCWSPEGDDIPDPRNALLDDVLGLDAEEPPKFKDYQDELGKKLMSYQSNLKNKLFSETVLVSFDAATSGRLSITDYSEMLTVDFLQRLYDWDDHCVWFEASGKYYSSPSLPAIILYAFGAERERTQAGKIEVDDSVYKQTMERLLRCRTGREKFPYDIERKIVENASRLNLYGNWTRRELLSIACAVIRKYHFDQWKEDIDMELDAERGDRSYQFGRLLAVYEKIERDTFDSDEKREPNAMRLQFVYCNRPMHYAFELEKQMERAYIPRLSPGTRVFYKNLIGEIMDKIQHFPESEWDKPLGDTYLPGYYLQRRSLYPRREKAEA